MTPSGLTLSELNRLPPQAFVAALGEVFEHAPWVAEAALPGRPYETVAALHAAMTGAVRAARLAGSSNSSRATPSWAAGSSGSS